MTAHRRRRLSSLKALRMNCQWSNANELSCMQVNLSYVNNEIARTRNEKNVGCGCLHAFISLRAINLRKKMAAFSRRKKL